MGPVTVSVNGFARSGVALPFAVMASALVLLSINVVDWQVSRDTFDAVAPWLVVVSGDVEGVKLVVYRAWPLVIRKLDRLPVK